MIKIVAVLMGLSIWMNQAVLGVEPAVAVAETGSFAIRGNAQPVSSRITFYDINSRQPQFRVDTIDVAQIAPAGNGQFFIGSLTHGYYSNSNETTILQVDPVTKQILSKYQHPRRIAGSLFGSFVGGAIFEVQGNMLWMVTSDPVTHGRLVEGIDWEKRVAVVKYTVPPDLLGSANIFPQSDGCILFLQPKPYESTGLKYHIVFIPIHGVVRDEVLDLPVPSGECAFISPIVVDNVLIAVRKDGTLLTVKLPSAITDAKLGKPNPVLSANLFSKEWAPWQIIPLPRQFGGDAAVAFLKPGDPGGYIRHIIVLKNGQRLREDSISENVHAVNLVRADDHVLGYAPESYSLVEFSPDWKQSESIPLMRGTVTLTGTPE